MLCCFIGNCLFFGCRQKSKDFYCQAEWEELVKRGLLTLFTAFSRDQVSSEHKILLGSDVNPGIVCLLQPFEVLSSFKPVPGL